MNILITSCWHLSSSSEEIVLKRTEEIIGIIKARKVEALFILGDFWHNAVRLSDTYPIDTAVKILSDISEFCPVVLFYGTQSHDIPGSLFFFDKITTKYPISLIKEHGLYGFDGLVPLEAGKGKWDFYALPVMSKTQILHKAGISRTTGTIKQSNDLVSKIIEEAIPKATTDNSLLLGHYSSSNVKSHNNFISSNNDIVLNSDYITKLGYAHVIQGHIHEPQEANGVIFVGSLYPTTVGDDKQRRMLLYDTETKDLESIPITTNVNHLIEVTYDSENFDYKYDLNKIKTDDGIVFRIKIKNIFNKPTQTKIGEFLLNFSNYNILFPIKYEIEEKEKKETIKEVIPISGRVSLKLKDLGFSEDRIEEVMDTLNIYLRACGE